MPKPSNVSVAHAVAAEAPPKRPRRDFSAAEKLRIVEEANACTEPGQIAALLRREGIYSSHLATWRKKLRLKGSEGLGVAKPGRKPSRDDRDKRIEELERKAAHLEKKLALAQQLLALQKKASELLGIDLATDETR